MSPLGPVTVAHMAKRPPILLGQRESEKWCSGFWSSRSEAFPLQSMHHASATAGLWALGSHGGDLCLLNKHPANLLQGVLVCWL